MANYIVDGADLTSIANAIRTKSGGSAQLAFPAGFVSEIGNIESGGGGGISGVTVVEDTTLTENVRSVQFDIPTPYDYVCVLVSGEFTEETWLYWRLNEITEAYMLKATQIGRAFLGVSLSDKATLIGLRHNGTYLVMTDTSTTAITVHMRGYSADFKAGTRFLLLGGKYADL